MKNPLILFILVFIALIFFVGFSQFLYLKKAHSTFENYYKFRGCAQLLKKTESYGTCKTSSGETIKIVKYNNKWYLDGDLPWGCFGKICLGW